MTAVMSVLSDRRNFLRFLAASPLAARAWAQDVGTLLSPQSAPAPTGAKAILNTMEFEELAHQKIPIAHWAYLNSGVDDDATKNINHQAFSHIQLRPRRLAEPAKIDTKVEILGTVWDSPIYLCPVGSQKAFFAEGEIAVARAAKAKKTLQVLSTVTSASVEEVAQALGRPPWMQLYMPSTWEATEKLVKRAEAAGCQALCWTVDLYGGRNTETAERGRRLDNRPCASCHDGPANLARIHPMTQNLGKGSTPTLARWTSVERLKKMTSMKLFIKGIDNREDARLCVEHGADGVMVSNHGGRSMETLRATIDCLPEVVDAAGGRVPVFVDGGFRRGTDVFKALALGARAVGIGRPYIWGLGAFGQDGVERVLDILNGELRLVMRQAGTPSLADITPAYTIREPRA